MYCLQTLKGINADCQTNLGGIVEAYFGGFGQFDITLNTGHTHTVSAMTAVSGASDGKLYKYEFARQTGSLTSTITVDEANGVRYYTNSVTLQFNRLKASKHVEVEALAAGQLVGIFKDSNGKYWLVGYDSYLSATEAQAQSGQAYGDLNGYTTTLSQMSAHLPYEIDYATFSALIDGE